ncbi:hypothetical protein ACOMHN_017686 [Nucella lapillus]
MFLLLCVLPVSTMCLNSASECTTSGSFPSCGDCTQFIKCDGTRGNRYTCPFSLFYDVNLAVCQFPSQAVCGTTTRAPTTSPTSPTASPDPSATCLTSASECVGVPIGQYPFCSDCTKYMFCFGSSGNLIECPHNLYYDVNLQVCQYADLAMCG